MLSLKAVLAVVLVVGSAIMLLMLATGQVPPQNKDFFEIAQGAWLAWAAMAVKRVFDGSDSSDSKNETINQLAKATNTAMALPPAPRRSKHDPLVPEGRSPFR
jgi:hypothetical protein